MPHPHPIPAVEDAEYKFRLVLSYPLVGQDKYRFIECASPRMLHNAMKRVSNRSWFDALVDIEAVRIGEESNVTILHHTHAGPIDVVLKQLANKCKSELANTQWEDAPYAYVGEQTVRLEEAQEWLHAARQMALEF